jgi:condensin complex subunit 1
MYMLHRGFSSLEPVIKGSLIESLSSNFSVLLPNITSLLRSAHDSSNDSLSLGNHIHSHRNAFRIYAYFLQSIIFAEAAGADTEKEIHAVRTTTKVFILRKRKLTYIRSFSYPNNQFPITSLFAVQTKP